jgi:hypothetical protein
MGILDDLIRLADDVFRSGHPVAIAVFIVFCVLMILGGVLKDVTVAVPNSLRIVAFFAILITLLYFFLSH